MAEPSPRLLAAIRFVDRFTRLSGTAVSWLSIPLVGVVAYEVIARYLFNAPTSWALDATAMLYGTLFMLGAAYALLIGAHIRTDFFWAAYSTRTKGIIDAAAYALFFFPGLTALLVIGGGETLYSFRIGETSDQTPWRPWLWPYKAMVPLACLLLMVQGISEFLKSIYMARTGLELDHKEMTEL
jgi:TRAP-type mannitol/chloroaromatic compound transport system permease small subunit